MSLMSQLERTTRAALAEASVMGRPLGRIITQATARALELERQRRTRPGEVERFFDNIGAFKRTLEREQRSRR